jgi:NADH-quinone oxidoreductase subunit K
MLKLIILDKINDFIIEDLLKSLPSHLGMELVDALIFFFMIFFIGLTGVIFNYRNYLVTMLCIEIMYLGITVCFLIVSTTTADPKGQIYALILLIVAAAESSVGLGMLVVLYKFGKSIDFLDYTDLRG